MPESMQRMAISIANSSVILSAWQGLEFKSDAERFLCADPIDL